MVAPPSPEPNPITTFDNDVQITGNLYVDGSFSGGGSTHVLYASALGCALNTNLMTGGGTSDAAILNAALATAPTLGALELVIDGPALINTPLVVHSNTTITFLPGAGIYSGSGMNGPAIRNAHWISSYNGGSPVYDGSTIVDQNITIRGPGLINGNRGNGTNGNATSGQPQYSVPGSNGITQSMEVCPITIAGVKNLKLYDITIYNPSCYHYWINNAFGVRMNNTSSIDPGVSPTNLSNNRNSDGIHFNGPIDDLQIFGHYMQAGDDGIALNAADGWLATDSGADANFFGLVYGGPITRVNIQGVTYNTAASFIRLLNGIYLIDQVSATGLSGNVMYEGAVDAQLYPNLPTTGGIIGRIYVDADATFLANPSQTPVSTNTVWLQGTVQDYSMTIRMNSGAGTIFPPAILDGNINKCRLDISAMDNGTTSNGGALVQVTGGNVNFLGVKATYIQPGQGSPTSNPLISVTGGSVQSLKVYETDVDSQGGILNQSGGSMYRVNVSNTCITDIYSGNHGVTTSGTIASLGGTGNVGVTTSGTFTVNTLASQ